MLDLTPTETSTPTLSLIFKSPSRGTKVALKTAVTVSAADLVRVFRVRLSQWVAIILVVLGSPTTVFTSGTVA